MKPLHIVLIAAALVVAGAFVLVSQPAPAGQSSLDQTPVVSAANQTPGIGQPAANATTQAPGTPATPAAPGQAINVTGHGLYKQSDTQFVFSDGAHMYNVTMDVTTQVINLRNKIIGGYQLVAAILMVTSEPLTITGTLSDGTIMAQTVLIPTNKDAIT
jgi:hypothetical protein